MLLISGGSGESFVQFLTVLVLFCVVLAITYITTRWIANFQKTRQEGSNIQVLETCKIAPNAYIQIVKIGLRFVAVAVCKDTVRKIVEIKYALDIAMDYLETGKCQDNLMLESAKIDSSNVNEFYNPDAVF